MALIELYNAPEGRHKQDVYLLLKKWVSENETCVDPFETVAWFGKVSIMKSIDFRVRIIIPLLALNGFRTSGQAPNLHEPQFLYQ